MFRFEMEDGEEVLYWCVNLTLAYNYYLSSLFQLRTAGLERRATSWPGQNVNAATC